MSKSHNRTRYPLLPLRDMVIFPGNVASLFVGREKSMESTRAAMDSDRRIVLATQKKTETVIPNLEDLFETAVLCEILQLLKMPDGTYKILVEGLSRANLKELYDSEIITETAIQTVESLYPASGGKDEHIFQKSLTKLVDAFEKINSQQSITGKEFLRELIDSNNPEKLIDSIAHILPAHYSQKQEILQTLHVLERSEKVRATLENLLEISSLEGAIHEKVRAQMDKMQRQYYLNEQIKAIREEMGDPEPDEFESLKRKIEEKNLPEEIKAKAESELRKLEKMPPMSAESGVVRNYLDWLLDLPWNETTSDNADISHAHKILEESHYGLEKIKDRILEFIAVKQLAPASPGAVLCLVGPPGVGKTSLAKALADALGRKFARISLGGVRDEAEIRGHRRTYIGALPGRLIATLKKVKVKNPVILLDEIDKISSDFRGNPAAALLETLDPEQNAEFTDHYLDLPFDLSQVLFVATANVTHSIPEALLDRLEIIQLSGYTEMEKIQIAKKYLVPRQIEENGVAEIGLNYSNKSLAYIIRHYTKEAGVRQLEREIAQICRKIAREYLEKRANQEYLLDKTNIVKFLGPAKFNYTRKEKEMAIGKVNGLAWTSAGGDILSIEVALAHGKGKLTITGNLGDVMKESATTAYGYIRSQAHLLGLESDFFEKNDLYIHVPEGAIPKDGPSAGITIATAIISALTQRGVKNDFAMTGEITLRGMVLPIGGLKEKALAAFRGGITDIIFPKENEKDVEDIPAQVREQLKLHSVEHVRQVIKLAMVEGDAVFTEKKGMYGFYATHLPGHMTPPNA